MIVIRNTKKAIANILPVTIFGYTIYTTKRIHKSNNTKAVTFVPLYLKNNEKLDTLTLERNVIAPTIVNTIPSKKLIKLFIKSPFYANYSASFFTISVRDDAIPAMLAISEGIISLVALPSAAFAKASRLLIVRTACCGAASFKNLIPSALAC